MLDATIETGSKFTDSELDRPPPKSWRRSNGWGSDLKDRACKTIYKARFRYISPHKGSHLKFSAQHPDVCSQPKADMAVAYVGGRQTLAVNARQRGSLLEVDIGIVGRSVSSGDHSEHRAYFHRVLRNGRREPGAAPSSAWETRGRHLEDD